MPQSPEAELFLDRVLALPDGPVVLDDVLQPSLEDEAVLRTLFATDRDNARLKDIHVGLVDVFDAPSAIRTTRARTVKDEEDLSAQHIMPLAADDRRKEGTPCAVETLEDFKKNWAVFTEGSLSALPLGTHGWNNVVAAGGSVLACVAPVPDEAKTSKRNMRKWYHTEKYPTSDVDLFLHGLTAEQAEVRINEIYEAVRDSVPWDVTCVRTKHTVSIHSQYPYRSVQIVLRLYSSPAEILAGFDIDAPCVAYDGQTLWANPRSIVAMMRQSNTVDMTRRSPSYEVRLCKYAARGFEVYVPTLKREDIDPTIYERAIGRVTGLARLLVLEKLADPAARSSFVEYRRNLRGRPNQASSYYRRGSKYKGDLKAEKSILDDLAMNDYDVTSLHIPYGPGWDARRIDKLIYQTDLGMNSPFNPKNKNRRLHRHPAFFGTMHECLEDCCEYCPEPIDDDEKKLQETEDDTYIRGRISFIEEDPGRQSPTERLFSAIAAGERSTVKALIDEQEQLDVAEAEALKAEAIEVDPTADDKKDGDAEVEKKISHKQRYVNRRDHVGRTALHFAILCKREDIACDLIDAGIRITARLFDGRTALHLAVQLDQTGIVQKLLKKSQENEAAAIKAGLLEKPDVVMGDASETKVRDSSEDDWSSEENDDDDVEMTDAEDEDDDGDGDDDDEDKPQTSGKKDDKGNAPVEVTNAAADLPEDEDDLDILKVNEPDWDLAFTPLHYAALYASVPVLDLLIDAQADVTLATKANSYDAPAFHPLTLTILRSDVKTASLVAERLIRAGAKSSAADNVYYTIFHWAVAANQIRIVQTILEHDEGASTVIDFPQMNYAGIVFPIITAISKGNYAMVALLMAYGAKLSYKEEEISDLIAKVKVNFGYSVHGPLSRVYHPIEVAVAKFDTVADILLAFGADPNVWIKSSFEYSSDGKKTVLDWLQGAIPWIDTRIAAEEQPPAESPAATKGSVWETYLANYQDSLQEVRKAQQANNATTDSSDRLQNLKEIKAYLVHVKTQLEGNGAKLGREVDPPLAGQASTNLEFESRDAATPAVVYEEAPYALIIDNYYNAPPVSLTLKKSYDELYEACLNGDNTKVEELCLPPKSGKAQSRLLQITVTMRDPKNHWRKQGFTPLFAAIQAGHWSTARLIMAIATAQYKPTEEEESPGFTTKNIHLDSDDSGSEDSDDSDMTVDQREFEFTDVANRASEIECSVNPKTLLDLPYEGITTDYEGKRIIQDILFLTQTIYAKDLEAFKHVASMYANLKKPSPLNVSLMDVILKHDCPEILEEYIRRTGYGIAIKLDPKDEEELRASNDGDRVYLGLNVHGKKRADLARKNDPNAQQVVQDETPLVWKAAAAGASDIVEFLHGDKVLPAYRHYASSYNDERALKLGRYKNLDTALPELLGWTINAFGESPLTAAIISRKLDIIKRLYKLAPKLMSEGMKQRIKFLGFNPTQIAIHRNCEPPLVDFLLANGGVVLDWHQGSKANLFHYLCEYGAIELFDFLTKKLSQDQVLSALVQPSRSTSSTPLHIAVDKGYIRIVERILTISKEALTIRNRNGATPLHIAVHQGYARIAKILIDAGPPELLATENGVGETPIETATFRETVWRTRSYISSVKGDPSGLPFRSVGVRPVFNLAEKERTIPELREALTDLIGKGKLNPSEGRTQQLLGFASRLEQTLKSERRKAQKKEGEELKVDTCNKEATFKVVAEATAKHHLLRQLVHLVDVQKVVLGGMPEGNALEVKEWADDELEPEEDEEEVQRRRSHMLRFFSVNDL
ncbi:Ankyrin repeat protein [Pleurotus pulmonarius]